MADVLSHGFCNNAESREAWSGGDLRSVDDLVRTASSAYSSSSEANDRNRQLAKEEVSRPEAAARQDDLVIERSGETMSSSMSTRHPSACAAFSSTPPEIVLSQGVYAGTRGQCRKLQRSPLPPPAASRTPSPLKHEILPLPLKKRPTEVRPTVQFSDNGNPSKVSSLVSSLWKSTKGTTSHSGTWSSLNEPEQPDAQIVKPKTPSPANSPPVSIERNRRHHSSSVESTDTPGTASVTKPAKGTRGPRGQKISSSDGLGVKEERSTLKVKRTREEAELDHDLLVMRLPFTHEYFMT